MSHVVGSDKFSDTLFSGMRFVLGDGKRLKFWDNEWTPGNVMKLDFPRIFALALNKNGRVAEFRELFDNVWC